MRQSEKTPNPNPRNPHSIYQTPGRQSAHSPRSQEHWRRRVLTAQVINSGGFAFVPAGDNTVKNRKKEVQDVGIGFSGGISTPAQGSARRCP
ncbi:hypothetical protein K438DRAFT_1993670 [Mycena galopus ATCC 62051]|nr:hypothetical protein K438DRAFT_1993670 [Mycena galopus ATCC 62051]